MGESGGMEVAQRTTITKYDEKQYYMRALHIRLGAFYLYYAILLLRYFCPNFYLFIFLTISTCGRGAK